ncbi:DeoR/GlpR family DNA-binding transcription regulator [Sporolactobacillus shoreicorticis]|uniref:DeoR/GlpR family DNA-binding transcription regulator n=1 Tax=Sporolactobacillus shoreicorticis TaxID=1923877 RepID=A0ABW5RXA6_9BACL|nr:DeoR/GlpR family DNA-binding transcription regulator [Sporolactobacillus shoreicorticis]MCO7124962.1 DeoR/GlpR family DNA-binding transcription regulator [Sporolactobacillus shoreicorticis]
MRVIYQEERLAAILDDLQKARSLSVADICRLYQVSRDTARRDIVKLTEQKAAIRTHGGIALPDFQNKVLAYRDRLQAYSDAKIQIGKKALNFLQRDGFYFFNASTTISCMVRQINLPIHVFTQSLDVAELLSQKEEIPVHLFGGLLNGKNRFFFSAESIKHMETIRFDAAFLGAAAVTEDGIYYDDEEDALISRTISKCSDRIIILTDHKKFDQKSRFKGFDWSTADFLITDHMHSEQIRTSIEEQGVHFILAD